MSFGGVRIPDVSAAIPYPEFDDAFAAALLSANGVELDRDGLLAALDSPHEYMRGAAARTLGARGETAAIPRLRELAGTGDGSDRAEAAFALVRLGEREAGLAGLRACLALPAEWAVAALQAAGMLARLGDPSGAPAILRGLRASNAVLRNVAAKQLYFLAPFDGQDVDGKRLDVFGLLERAAQDRDPAIARQAQIELRDLERP